MDKKLSALPVPEDELSKDTSYVIVTGADGDYKFKLKDLLSMMADATDKVGWITLNSDGVMKLYSGATMTNLLQTLTLPSGKVGTDVEVVMDIGDDSFSFMGGDLVPGGTSVYITYSTDGVNAFDIWWSTTDASGNVELYEINDKESKSKRKMFDIISGYTYSINAPTGYSATINLSMAIGRAIPSLEKTVSANTENIASEVTRATAAEAALSNTVSGISIGGRNYLRNTGDLSQWLIGSNTDGIGLDGNMVTLPALEAQSSNNSICCYPKTIYSLIDKKIVTVSVDVMRHGVSDTGNVYMVLFRTSSDGKDSTRTAYKRLWSANVADLTANVWVTKTYTFTISDSWFSSDASELTDADIYMAAETYNYSLDKVSLRNFKLEIGNKRTDWSAAPEDVVLESKLPAEVSVFAPVNRFDLMVAIPSSADLNDYKTPGTYYSSNTNVSVTLLNTPVTAAGFRLVVYNNYSSNNYLQELYSLNTNMYYRTYSASGWGNWYQRSVTVATTYSNGVENS